MFNLKNWVKFKKSGNHAIHDRGIRAAASVVVESLESRALFSVSPHVTPDPGSDFAHAFNVGDLSGQVTLSDTVGPSDTADVYKFTMTQDGQFFGRIRATAAHAEIALIQEQTDPDGTVHEVFVDSRVATQDGADAGFASGDLPPEFLTAGNYFLFISALGGDTPYLIRFTSDYAGNSLATARNIGSLTDAHFQDFIGTFPSPSLEDPFDTYKFKMDAPGAFTADFSLDSTQTDTFQAHIALIHDSNGNGVIDPGDLLVATPAGTNSHISTNLAAGTYLLRVVSDLNFSNYHLHMNADYAGSTPGTTRVMESLDAGKGFNDFISSATDPLDQYKFSVNATRPLFLALASGDDNGIISVTLFKDANNDGVAQPGERVTASVLPHFNDILTTIGPGNYIVQVHADSAGEGTYQLFAEARPDRAGNTLKAAKNLGTINGLTHLDDYVSSQDPVDFYKFTAAASGTIGASLFTEFGGNASLALIKDANNNGVVDRGELLAAANLTSTGAKEFTKPISAGNYFLRVTSDDHDGSVAKYFLDFQTDYASSTPRTARNVGTLSGTKTFDDWASGPFTGAISDTADLYKFSLASTKTFSAKMVGLQDGQDLDLQLFRDKNNDGVLSSSELVTSSRKLNSPNEQITKSLAAGTYFLRVVGVNGETNYHLTLKA